MAGWGRAEGAGLISYQGAEGFTSFIFPYLSINCYLCRIVWENSLFITLL